MSEGEISIYSAIIGALGVVSGVLTAFLTQLLLNYQKNRNDKKGKTVVTERDYLFPLWVSVQECSGRLIHIRDKQTGPQERRISDKMKLKDIEDLALPHIKIWAQRDGYYFCSTCYILVSFFAQIYRLESQHPPLYMKKKKYDLLNHNIKEIAKIFSEHNAIYIKAQSSAGQHLSIDALDRKMSYAEFCYSLHTDESARITYHKVIAFVIRLFNSDTEKGRLNQVIKLLPYFEDLNMHLNAILKDNTNETRSIYIYEDID